MARDKPHHIHCGGVLDLNTHIDRREGCGGWEEDGDEKNGKERKKRGGRDRSCIMNIEKMQP